MRLHNHSLSLSLSFLVALFAVLAYKHFINPNPSFLKYLIHHFKLLPLGMMGGGGGGGHHHHQHKQHPHKGKIVYFCDDFPPDFPPPETNTTSYICVDQNGCCNFTTVQAAIDAVPIFSMKRTIIWINSGIYL